MPVLIWKVILLAVFSKWVVTGIFPPIVETFFLCLCNLLKSALPHWYNIWLCYSFDWLFQNLIFEFWINWFRIINYSNYFFSARRFKWLWLCWKLFLLLMYFCKVICKLFNFTFHLNISFTNFLKNPFKEFIFSKAASLQPSPLLKIVSFTCIFYSKFKECLF